MAKDPIFWYKKIDKGNPFSFRFRKKVKSENSGEKFYGAG